MIPPIHPKLTRNGRFHFRHHTHTHFPRIAARLASLRSAFNEPAVPSPAEPSAFSAYAPAPAEDFFSQIWTPGLLDNLREPLSRYHE
jgi:hypothetical protein